MLELGQADPSFTTVLLIVKSSKERDGGREERGTQEPGGEELVL